MNVAWPRTTQRVRGRPDDILSLPPRPLSGTFSTVPTRVPGGHGARQGLDRGEKLEPYKSGCSRPTSQAPTGPPHLPRVRTSRMIFEADEQRARDGKGGHLEVHEGSLCLPGSSHNKQ